MFPLISLLCSDNLSKFYFAFLSDTIIEMAIQMFQYVSFTRIIGFVHRVMLKYIITSLFLLWYQRKFTPRAKKRVKSFMVCIDI